MSAAAAAVSEKKKRGWKEGERNKGREEARKEKTKREEKVRKVFSFLFFFLSLCKREEKVRKIQSQCPGMSSQKFSTAILWCLFMVNVLGRWFLRICARHCDCRWLMHSYTHTHKHTHTHVRVWCVSVCVCVCHWTRPRYNPSVELDR